MKPLDKKIMTEALVYRDDKILLGRKKKNGFAQGKWLGFGGKLEAGETIEEAMKREFFEETGAKVKTFAKRGVLTFYYVNDPEMEVHYFEVMDFSGEAIGSEEMEARWFGLDQIPYDQMFPNDRYWLPMFLKKRFFEGEFSFDADYQIIEHRIEENKTQSARWQEAPNNKIIVSTD